MSERDRIMHRLQVPPCGRAGHHLQRAKLEHAIAE